MELSPSWRRPLLTVHVVAAVSIIGADLVLLALGISAVGGADPQIIYPAASLVASRVIAPLVVVALGTGVLQAVLSPWGLTRYWWVTIKLVATVVFTGIVVFVLVPRLAASAEAAAAAQTFSTAERLPLAMVPSVAVTVLVVLVALAISKPGWRMRSRRLPSQTGDARRTVSIH